LSSGEQGLDVYLKALFGVPDGSYIEANGAILIEVVE
jgi:hypothetical protein